MTTQSTPPAVSVEGQKCTSVTKKKQRNLQNTFLKEDQWELSRMYFPKYRHGYVPEQLTSIQMDSAYVQTVVKEVKHMGYMLISSNGTEIYATSFKTLKEAQERLKNDTESYFKDTKKTVDESFSWRKENSVFLCSLDVDTDEDWIYKIVKEGSSV